MTIQPEIRVGLVTSCEPVISKQGDYTCIDNLLIGDGFHWQKRMRSRFSGRIEKPDKPEGNVSLVNILPIEEYLLSVIGSEMNPDSPVEFLKAHAIISRSWAIRKLANQEAKPSDDPYITWEESDTHIAFHVCNDDHCQRYQGLPDNISPSIREAVDSTRGTVIVSGDGSVADARFSKCCGGTSEKFSTCWADDDPPYLDAVDDTWCDLSDMSDSERETFLNCVMKTYDRDTSDFHDWEAVVTPTVIRKNLQKRYNLDLGEIQGLEKIEVGSSGRIKKLKIIGSEGEVTVGKELAIRKLLSDNCLYSSWFDIEKTDCGFRLHGHGWGHGVGLCQIGAARMAWEGKTYEEILNFYYKDITLKKIY